MACTRGVGLLFACHRLLGLFLMHDNPDIDYYYFQYDGVCLPVLLLLVSCRDVLIREQIIHRM